MAWRDEITAATYKGVEFRTDRLTMDFGWELQESKKRGLSAARFESSTPSNTNQATTFEGARSASTAETPFTKPLTKLPRRFRVTAYFEGDEYILQRNRFIAAVEEKTAGVLKLPTYDPIRVVPMLGSLSFSNQVGGREDVTIIFVQEGDLVGPTEGDDTFGSLTASVDAANEAATEDLETNTVVEGVPKTVVDSQQESVENYITVLREALRIGVAGADVDFDEANALIDELEADLVSIITVPSDLAERVIEIQTNFIGSFASVLEAFNYQIYVFDNYPTALAEITGTSSLPTAQRDNQVALRILIQTACLSSAASALSSASFASVTNAIEVSDTFNTAVEELQLYAGDFPQFATTYVELVHLRAAVYNDISSRTAALPALEEVVVKDTVPAYVLAYNRYANANRFDEIVDRNDIARPLFARGDLELLSY